MDYLPVFLDLRGRSALVVGAGAVAARKISLLLEAGAVLRVVAPECGAEVAALRDAGRVEYLAQEFTAQHLTGMVFAIAATDQPLVNREVARAGTAAGIWVNVVDDTDACTCIMPAIIDRSPVIVAIGTAGTSPTLARRLRAQIEGLLPEGLGTLAAFAGRWRERVSEALPDVGVRRRFWEGWLTSPIATGAEAGRDVDAAMARALDAAVVGRAAPRGEVWLIGAGPGDPDLLTLKALQALQDADVVLYDRLVSKRVLDRARRDADRIFVGKESGQHRTTQARINQLMLEHAGHGRRVARLKGGDPFVFGRGGEELEALAAAGIPVTVIPGVTAALGAAAAAGIPLTHRGVAQSVCFVTAMSEGTELLDWRSLAQPLQTVVYYMGVAQLPRIVERLKSHGAPGSRAVAVIERATLPDERRLLATLDDVVEKATAAGVNSPALLVVGDVVQLSRNYSSVGSSVGGST